MRRMGRTNVMRRRVRRTFESSLTFLGEGGREGKGGRDNIIMIKGH